MPVVCCLDSYDPIKLRMDEPHQAVSINGQEGGILTSSLVQLFLPTPALQGVALHGHHASTVKEMLLAAFFLPPLTFFDTAAKISILSNKRLQP